MPAIPLLLHDACPCRALTLTLGCRFASRRLCDGGSLTFGARRRRSIGVAGQSVSLAQRRGTRTHGTNMQRKRRWESSRATYSRSQQVKATDSDSNHGVGHRTTGSRHMNKFICNYVMGLLFVLEFLEQAELPTTLNSTVVVYSRDKHCSNNKCFDEVTEKIDRAHLSVQRSFPYMP
jgi:hypothetical protein